MVYVSRHYCIANIFQVSWSKHCHSCKAREVGYSSYGTLSHIARVLGGHGLGRSHHICARNQWAGAVTHADLPTSPDVALLQAGSQVLHALQLPGVVALFWQFLPLYMQLLTAGMLLAIIGMLLTLKGENVHTPSVRRTRLVVLMKVWLTIVLFSMMAEDFFSMMRTIPWSMCVKGNDVYTGISVRI